MTLLNSRQRQVAFTLVETMSAVAVFSLLMAGLVATWSSLTGTALNTAAYAERQNDQMRVLDYLKRDIRRASKVELYNGGTLVSNTTTLASELRLTVPDYYSDSREEDDAIGTKTTNTPALVSEKVAYGTALTIRYYGLNGAALRDEAGTLRTLGNQSGAFALLFKRETGGAIRCRVFFDQQMRSGLSRTLRRQVDTLCVPRAELQL